MKKAILLLLLLCILETAANYALSRFSEWARPGLFLDTVFTVSAVFSGGLLAGVLTAVFTTILYGLGYAFWGYWLFGICSLAAAFLTYLFVRRFPRECGTLRIIGVSKERPDLGAGTKPAILDRIIILILLSLAMCALMSILGGLISAFIQLVLLSPMDNDPPETIFKLGFLRQGFSLAAAEILARIPVNVLDRIIAIFGGYGAALLLQKVVLRRKG
jgi:hypothetical protein